MPIKKVISVHVRPFNLPVVDAHSPSYKCVAALVDKLGRLITITSTSGLGSISHTLERRNTGTALIAHHHSPTNNNHSEEDRLVVTDRRVVPRQFLLLFRVRWRPDNMLVGSVDSEATYLTEWKQIMENCLHSPVTVVVTRALDSMVGIMCQNKQHCSTVGQGWTKS